MLRGRVPDMVIDEWRRGRQSSDWFQHLGSLRAELLAELSNLERDPDIRKRLHLSRLRKAVADWPSSEPSRGSAERLTLAAALTRALTTARFIRFIEARNN
jgi:hypothetical protein